MKDLDERRHTKKGEKDGGRMLSIRDASQLLNVHRNTLRRWSERGVIKAYRMGIRGHRMFKREEVVALLVEEPEPGQVMRGH